MSNKYSVNYIVALFALACMFLGCSYYNTFYNTKKAFEDAEKETKNRVTVAPSAPKAGDRPGTKPAGARTNPSEALIAPDKYRKVIETGSKLLELYPNSAWVDDALLLMGISYYRLRDFNRADRKFDELITLYPNSKNVSDAKLWKARTLIELNKKSDAIALLETASTGELSNVKKAEAEFLLGKMLYDTMQWKDALEHLKTAADFFRDYNDRMEATYYLGRCQYELADYASSMKSFDRVGAYKKNLQLSYNALIFLAKTEAALGNVHEGELLLKEMEGNPIYKTLSGDLDIELADLSVRSEKLDEGIKIYQEYIKDHTNGEGRGLAFFRLAQISLEDKNNLTLAKNLLDSCIACGASRDIADSARYESTQLSRGLLAIKRIQEIKDSLSLYETRPASVDSTALEAENKTETVSQDSLFTDSSDKNIQAIDQLPDSLNQNTVLLTLPSDSLLKDSVSIQSIPSISPKDSLAVDTASSKLALVDSLKSDTVSHKAQTDSTHEKSPKLTKKGEKKNSTPADDNLSKAKKLKHELQDAYLHVGEFYAYSLMSKDSAESYYKMAASSKDNAHAYWKAQLYLGNSAEGKDSSISEASKLHYQAVVSADSVPLESANYARTKLRIPTVEPQKNPQKEALESAENAYWRDNVPPAEALELYSKVIGIDSTTNEAKTALFAKAEIYYKHLKLPDSSAIVYNHLIALFPDSSFVGNLRKKVAPPDSNSIFNKTDEELFPQKQDIKSLIEQPADSSGWPPAEETLRGRR